MDKILVVDYFNREDLCTHIEIINGIVTFTNYTEEPLDRAFGNQVEVNLDSFNDFLEGRCLPKTRANIKRALKNLDVDHFDAYAICRKTHGVLWEDFNWIRFNNEDLCWNDVKLRD